MTSPRVLAAVAIVSLVLNLLLVGFVVGQRLPHFSAPFRDPPRAFTGEFREPLGHQHRVARAVMGPTDLNFMAAVRALDPEARAPVEAAFKERLPEIRAGIDEMIAKRRALLAVLADEPADMERLSEALSEVRAAGAAAQDRSHRIFLEIAASLPQEQRAAFLKAAAGRGPRAPR